MSMEATNKANELFDLLSREMYYGLNLRLVLAEDCSDYERAVLHKILNTARLARSPLAKRETDPSE